MRSQLVGESAQITDDDGTQFRHILSTFAVLSRGKTIRAKKISARFLRLIS
jgi:hypothetical protein